MLITLAASGVASSAPVLPVAADLALGWLGAHAWPLLQSAAETVAQSATQSAAPVVQVARTLPDTIITKQVVAEPGTLERAAQVLRALMTLAIVVLTFAVVPAAWNFRKSYQKVSDLLDKVYGDVLPITQRAARITEHVEYVSASVRSDVGRVSALVADTEQRLQRAIARAERRARDLEALLDVATAEAQDTIVGAASAVRGVRAGVAALRMDLGEARRAAGAPRTRRAATDDPSADDIPMPDVPGALDAVDAWRAEVPRTAHAARSAHGVDPLDDAADDAFADEPDEQFDDDVYEDYLDLPTDADAAFADDARGTGEDVATRAGDARTPRALPEPAPADLLPRPRVRPRVPRGDVD